MNLKSPTLRSALQLRIFLLLSGLPLFAATEWTRIGLAGEEVTSLAIGMVWGDTNLFVGTKNQGVWYRDGSASQFQHLLSFGTNDTSQAPHNIHTLLAGKTNQKLWAGNDSGLAYFTFLSGPPSQWRRVKEISLPVTDIIASGDTLFCCTPDEVYRSFDAGVSWTACGMRSFLPMLGNITCFTSLTFFWGITAGSKFLGAMNSWEGVMNSSDWGATWTDISNLPLVEAQPIGEVFDLASYAPRFDAEERLLAATANGLLFTQGSPDTETWKAIDPPLKGITPRSVLTSFFSRSLIAELWVASNSGVHVLSSRINTVDWARSFERKTSCIVDNAQVDPTIWYAGTDDGVWAYPRTVSSIDKALPNKLNRVNRSTIRYYSLDGRLMRKSLVDRTTGVVVKVFRDGSGQRQVVEIE